MSVRRLVGILLAALAGCASRPIAVPVIEDDQPMHVVIERVNKNAAGMSFLLRAGGVSAHGEFGTPDRRESFELNGIMLYRRPRDLYLKLDHLGPAIEAGSNKEEFWFWKKITTPPEYSWGRHDLMEDTFDADIPFRPDLLAEVLGLGGLPAETRGPAGPVFWVGSSWYELIFMDRDAGGQLHVTKTIDIDRSPPFLVRSIVYFRKDGHPLMQASLDDYEKIEGSEVVAPRRIHFDWLPDRGWMDIELATMKRFDSPGAEERFRSPRQRGLSLGEVRRLDRPRFPATGRAAASAPARANPGDR